MKLNLEKLLAGGFLQKEKGIKNDQILKRIERAGIDLANAGLLIKTDKAGAYRMAYDAMLQAGIALVFSCGCRPKVAGFHKTVVEAVEAIAGEGFSAIVKEFDQMRKNRHEIIYDIGVISDTEAEESIKTAEEFIGKIKKLINERNPQKKLF